MKGKNRILVVAVAALISSTLATYWGLLASIASAQPYVETFPELRRDLRKQLEPKVKPGEEFPVPVKPLPKDISPCSACHGPKKDFPINFRRKEALLVHRNIELNHGGVRVWCLDCHHPEERNHLLPLSDGTLITFEHSYLLCGKCHGTKYRDWREGIHGKRTGEWNGKKEYYLCVNCHSPHSPRFKTLEPMPPPSKPWTPKDESAKH